MTISLPKGKDEEADVNPFYKQERDLIIQTFESDRYYSYYTPYVQFLFFTGCRPSEAIALQWKHITERDIQFRQAIVMSESGLVCKEGLPASLLEQVKKYPENESQFILKLRQYELIVDSEEQDRERPGDYETQKEYYSGKQKNHTFKNQFITLPLGSDIVDVVVGRPGPLSDINLCRERLDKFHPEQRLIGDKAYVGETQIKTPHKKPKKKEITQKQKEANKALSSKRIFVEHLIRVVKIFKVAQERFRLRKDRYASIILTICGLVRLRKGCLILEIVKDEYNELTIAINKHHSLGTNLPLGTYNP